MILAVSCSPHQEEVRLPAELKTSSCYELEQGLLHVVLKVSLLLKILKKKFNRTVFVSEEISAMAL